MNEIIAEIRLENIHTSNINISKSPQNHNYDRDFDLENSRKTLNQGFVWYRDFISFYMLSDYRRYWVKIATNDRLEIDLAIINPRQFEAIATASVIILPFQVLKEERIYVFGDNDKDVILCFYLSVGYYQLLFQNRYFTRDEIESDPIFNCDDRYELCLLTFIPTKEAIEPKILAYKSYFKSPNLPTSLILFARQMYENNND